MKNRVLLAAGAAALLLSVLWMLSARAATGPFLLPAALGGWLLAAGWKGR